MRPFLPVALAGLLVVILPHVAFAGTYVNFSVPGSVGTPIPSGINKWGSIAGYYPTSSGAYNGFLYQVSGVVTTFSVSKASGTYPLSISATGWIVGYYNDKAGVRHGFLRNPKYTILDAPGAGSSNAQGTQAQSINDAGQISGVYWDSNNIEHGFVRDALGNYSTFDVPGGSAVTSASLNQGGQIAGSYLTSSPNTSHGYIRDTAGNITSFDVNGALETFVAGVNAVGQTAGYYTVVGEPDGEFARDESGIITTFSVPGFVWTAGIEDNGDVIGSSQPAGTNKGWKRTTAGVVSYFQDPSASRGTYPSCVSGNGKVAGYYAGTQSASGAFELHN